jgi:alpha-L-arabinofuranosidase
MPTRLLSILVVAASLSATPSAEFRVKIEAGRTREPISPYIYGQFIEHLGRCIYGGIWAEMLEDRKFFYPITEEFKPWGTADDPYWNTGPFKYLNASPWQVIGPAGTVAMDRTGPYVGEQSPAIRLPGNGSPAGIAQDGLGVRAGRNYLGRVILAGDAGAAPVEVRLIWGDGRAGTETIRSLGLDFRSHALRFKAPLSSDKVRIEIVGRGKGSFRIGTLSLMPEDNLGGWRSDVVALLKELNAPVYRWPGGNFVSGYNWKDGIGERDRRPPRKNPAWKGVEHNDVGIHEYMELMRLIGAEPFVSVNTGLGTVEEVAAEAEYCNGTVDTPMGKLRAKNGHPEPYGVKWWAVGNEMYGSWQLGHMPLADYVKKHNRVAEAMWKVDPKAKLIAVGAVGEWSQTMLKACSDHMSLLSEHIYCKEKPDLLSHVRQLAEGIRRVSDAHRRYRNEISELKGKDIRIAMDEWNYWYGDYIYGELGVRYHLKDGLGVALGLHEYFRNSDIFFMANYAQTVNVIGAIKTTATEAAFETTGLALKLYRQHFGTIPVEVAGTAGNLDIAAAWTADRRALTVAIVNPEPAPAGVSVDVAGASLGTKVDRWVLTGPEAMSYNQPGVKPAVAIRQDAPELKEGLLAALPMSVTLYRLEAR